jgi:glyoxylase-like metal-dependent hydrolase (beta-lactamase superfamily II)
MSDYMASLELLLTRDDEIFWPTHGGPVREPKPFVEAFIAHRQAREHAILERLAAGDTTIGDMVPKIYQGVDPKLFPAAAMSMLAHVQHLVEKGDVLTDDTPDIQASYRLP